jgi:hypothetical protein
MLHAGSVCAQVDLSGNWQPAEPPFAQLIATGPPPGDFLGIPLNQAGRALAESANPDGTLEELGHQCQEWLTTFFGGGVFGVQIRPVGDPLNGAHILAWHLSGVTDRPAQTIWIDGRSPPAASALHTWGGFAVGHWEGNTLAASITNISDGWMTHNFAPESDQASVNMFLSRQGDLLVVTYIINDPVYLSAPFIRADTYKLSDASPSYSIGTVNDCLPAETLPGLNDRNRAAPPPAPGNNPALNFMMNHYGISSQISFGGPQEMYPEYQKTLRKLYHIPKGYCVQYCCFARGSFRGDQCPAPTLGPPPATAAASPETRGTTPSAL